MLKKILFTVIAIMGLSIATVSAREALYSDIDTYINHYPINAYAVDGKMTVVAEDLRDYGFNVIWDEGARALHISRNQWVTQLVRKDVYDPKYASGTKMSDIYYSDIKVDYEGIPLTSYALNGYTMIPINDFAELAGRGEWNEGIRAYKVWIDGLSVCDYRALGQRSYNIWYNTEFYDMPECSVYDDMDSDGNYDRIRIREKDIRKEYSKSIELEVGNISCTVTEAYSVRAVYVVDIVPNDGAKEVVMYFSFDSWDPAIAVYRYNGKTLEPITFKEQFRDMQGYTGEYYYNDINGVGNVVNFPFEINDDGSFTILNQTESIGMWSVYVTYKINSAGYLERVPQDVYLVPDSDYSYVKKTLTGHGMALYRGDWIKPIADDMNGHILIQKSNGTTGWITRNWDNYMLFWECSDLFAMAG